MEPGNTENLIEPRATLSDEEIERRWQGGDCPLTSRQAAELLGLRWSPDVLAQVARRSPDFPRPVRRGGKTGGHLYFKLELLAWLHRQPRVDSIRFRARGSA